MLRIGLIGFGFIAQYGHVPFYARSHNMEVLGIADCCDARLQVASRCFPDSKLFSSARDLLCELGSQMDVVDICAPPYTHYDLIANAVSCGCHVICEKPLVTKSEQVLDLARLSVSKNRQIYPCHNYRFSPAARVVQREIQQGRIGTPEKVVLHTYRTTHAKGVSEWKPDWRRHLGYSGGGILADHGPHSIYMANDFLGACRPTAVSCLAGQIRKDDYDTEDTVQIEITYDQGQQAKIFLSWASAYRSTQYLIVGTSGYIEVDDDRITIKNGEDSIIDDTEARFNDPSHNNWFEPLFLDFQHRIEDGDRPAHLEPLLEAYRVSAVIDAGYSSASTEGRWTPVSGTTCSQETLFTLSK